MNPITLKTMAAFPDQLAAHYAAIPTALINWTPFSWDGVPSEAFTAIEQLCHVRDIEVDGYHLRFHRALNEVNPILESIDSEALAKQRGYGSKGVSEAAEALSAFRLAREKTVALISALSDEQLDRVAVFEGYGPLTVRSLVHYLCSHDQQHLAGLQWLLGKMEAQGFR
jgi:hypothetical protein